MLRIRGAMLDELRATDWAPRTLRAAGRELEAAGEWLSARLHRSPTDAELSAELHWPGSKVHRVRTELQTASVTSIDRLTMSDDDHSGASIGDQMASSAPGPEQFLDLAADKDHVRSCIARLTERERTVIGLYYFEGLTLLQIGQILEVTESRVCQIHTQALRRLRELMNRDLAAAA
jgi:RNA polymerase sigma factor for flagellar operon FliA